MSAAREHLWTADMDAALAEALAGGASAREAMHAVSALGRPVTRSAVIGRAMRAGIPLRGKVAPAAPARQKPAPRVERRAAPKRAPAPRPALKFVALAAVASGGLASAGQPFARLSAGACRWPLADEADPAEAGTRFLFCCAPTLSGAVYCAGHGGKR